MNARRLWQQLLSGSSGRRYLVDLGSTSVSGPPMRGPAAVHVSDFRRLGVRSQMGPTRGEPVRLPEDLLRLLRGALGGVPGEHPLERATASQIRRLPHPAWPVAVEVPANAERTLLALDPPVPGLVNLCMTLRGPWRFLADLAEGSSVVESLLDWALAAIEQAYGALLSDGRRPDLLVYGDDLANERGSLLSPAEFRDVLAPRITVLFERFRAAGAAAILFHTCGRADPLLSEMVELGVDVLNLEARLMGGVRSLRKAIPAHVVLHGMTPLAQLGAALRMGDVTVVRGIVAETAAAQPIIVSDVGTDAVMVGADHIRAAVFMRRRRPCTALRPAAESLEADL